MPTGTSDQKRPDASVNPPGFLANPTRFMFFTGKGGVGKTSIACATALALADSGKSVLIASTDPASNLDEILGVPLGNLPVAVPGTEHLHVLNIDPTVAADAYRARVLAQMAPGHQREGKERGPGATIGRLHDRDRGIRRICRQVGGR